MTCAVVNNETTHN